MKKTAITPFQITTLLIFSGLLAIFCILQKQCEAAAFFLVLKSVLDAADGELARVKNIYSYIGRYYDSIADITLNLLFLLSFRYITDNPIFYVILAFIGVQLQGTLYNYYYVILRHNLKGDMTSRIFENEAPVAMTGEKQRTVNIFYKIYDFCYILFDRSIYHIDEEAMYSKPFPNWFMTMLSVFGLGFQLLIMAVMLLFGLQMFVLPFFIGFSVLILVFVGIRRWVLA